MLHVEGAAAIATADLSAQQLAGQLVGSLAQQSHSQVSHLQTPDSQQQPPSGQQLVQGQTLEAATGAAVLA